MTMKLEEIADCAERIGQLADRCDNFAGAAKLPFPDSIHKTQLASGMEEISAELNAIVVDMTGENPWES